MANSEIRCKSLSSVTSACLQLCFARFFLRKIVYFITKSGVYPRIYRRIRFEMYWRRNWRDMKIPPRDPILVPNCWAEDLHSAPYQIDERNEKNALLLLPHTQRLDSSVSTEFLLAENFCDKCSFLCSRLKKRKNEDVIFYPRDILFSKQLLHRDYTRAMKIIYFYFVLPRLILRATWMLVPEMHHVSRKYNCFCRVLSKKYFYVVHVFLLVVLCSDVTDRLHCLLGNRRITSACDRTQLITWTFSR